jgi:hypothetical protein
MTWPAGRAPTEPAPTTVAPQASVWVPMPPGRDRWRIVAYQRQFAAVPAVPIVEIMGARSRRLTQEWNKPALFSFVVDGTSAAAPLIQELMTDVVVYRWDEASGMDLALFRGLIAQSQDTLSEQAYSVTFTAHDYLDVCARRLLTQAVTWTQVDQDQMVGLLLGQAKAVTTSSGTALNPGAYLPLDSSGVDPAGNNRITNSGQKRDRTYPAQQQIDEAIFNLAAVENGFDFDVIPGSRVGTYPDRLRVFFPYQGVLRGDLILEYGSTVAAVQRSVNSADYSNYWRVIGAGSNPNDASAPPLFAERWNSDANNVTVTPVGLWMSGDNASDVTLQSTLNEKAGGNLALSGIITPSYTLTLRPGWYTFGNPNMGDVVRLRIRAGRLLVDTDVRVLGLDYEITDDGTENVNLTVGRPDVDFKDLFTRADRDINALARR